MAGQARTSHGARARLRLERQDLWQFVSGRQGDNWHELEWPPLLRPATGGAPVGRKDRDQDESAREDEARASASRCRFQSGGAAMKPEARKPNLRCVIYSRVSSDSGLEQEFNSLDNQREAAEAYVKSQAHEGWQLIRDRYDDGGFSGGSMERPALRKLMEEVRQ